MINLKGLSKLKSYKTKETEIFFRDKVKNCSLAKFLNFYIIFLFFGYVFYNY